MKTNWILASASSIGKAHLENSLPCQDSFKVKKLSRNCGITIIADGAGSCSHSQLGSKYLVENGISLFSTELIKTKFLKKKKPLRKDHWRKLVLRCFDQLQSGLSELADKRNIQLKDISSTIIVVAFSPLGIMSAHIGDGRAAFCDKKLEWKPIIKPFSGDEAGTTVFFTTKVVWEQPTEYIKTKIIKDEITGFSLLSDGMEKISYECYVKDRETEYYKDPNKPFPGFFNSIRKSLIEMSKENWSQKKINKQWKLFLTKGNQSIIDEPDDKTMIVGILKNSL